MGGKKSRLLYSIVYLITGNHTGVIIRGASALFTYVAGNGKCIMGNVVTSDLCICFITAYSQTTQAIFKDFYFKIIQNSYK